MVVLRQKHALLANTLYIEGTFIDRSAESNIHPKPRLVGNMVAAVCVAGSDA